MIQSGPYRLFFFSSDRREPVHVHVARDRRAAKFWLTPVRVEYNYGFTQREIAKVAALVREHEVEIQRAWHEYLATDTVAVDVKVTSDALVVALRDGRVVSVPLTWYPRLAAATPGERRRWELVGAGIGIHWPAIDEDVSVEALLSGQGSNESVRSLRRWQASRARQANKALQPPTRAQQSAKAKRPLRAARG